jgi:hypothetical protein
VERFYEIGDIVYFKKEGPAHQYEVVGVYPIEAGETHFRLKRIANYDPFDMNPTAERFYSTEYFYHAPYVLKRIIIFEKCLKT